MMLPGEECFRGNSWSQGPGVGAWRCVCVGGVQATALRSIYRVRREVLGQEVKESMRDQVINGFLAILMILIFPLREIRSHCRSLRRMKLHDLQFK